MIFNIFSKKDILIFIVAIAAVVYITTAFNSHGFYHADEHYQIIEFAGLKLGTHTPEELTWEFKAQIRPTFQPIICFGLLKSFKFLNIKNPYNQAFLLRLISALFAIVVIFFFIQNTKNFIKNKAIKIAYYFLSFFLWFIPIISIRFSSETWSGLCFLLSITYFIKDPNNKRTPYKIGFFLGISFLFRFQIAFAILGFGLWLILINHSKLKYLIKICTPFCAALVIGFLLDSWFYSKFVFTPWNYFYKNIIEGAASGFGTSPWYFYIVKLLSYPSYFIGIPILLSFIILLIKNPKYYVLWIIIPFIICHSIIAHKEERFLFPIVYFFPLMLIEGYTIIINLIKNRFFNKVINYSLIVIFVIVNTVGIIAMGQKSAGIGRMEITKYIHDKYGNENINLIFCSWANPYNPWHSLPIKFYLENSLTDHRINNLCELNDSLFRKDVVNLLVIRKIDKNNIECSKKIKNYNLILVKQSIPKWIERINAKYNGFDNQNILELYRYPKSE